jgi:hypothetical protein
VDQNGVADGTGGLDPSEEALVHVLEAGVLAVLIARRFAYAGGADLEVFDPE